MSVRVHCRRSPLSKIYASGAVLTSTVCAVQHRRGVKVDYVTSIILAPCAVSSESLALITISMLPDTRGLITDANSAALKLVGFNKREVIGRDVNAIIPDPVSAIHGGEDGIRLLCRSVPLH